MKYLQTRREQENTQTKESFVNTDTRPSCAFEKLLFKYFKFQNHTLTILLHIQQNQKKREKVFQRNHPI